MAATHSTLPRTSLFIHHIPATHSSHTCNSLYTSLQLTLHIATTHCIWLQPTLHIPATHSPSLQLTHHMSRQLTRCTSLQLTHCISLPLTLGMAAIHSRHGCNSLYISLQLGATGCLLIPHHPHRSLSYERLHTCAATHYNTLQHTTRHYNWL